MSNRKFSSPAALFAAAAVFSALPLSAQADCAQASASVAAAEAAVVQTANANIDSLGGLLGCMSLRMDKGDFRTAFVGAAAQIPNQPLAQLVIELGSDLLLGKAKVVPDALVDVPLTDSAASES